MGFLQGDDLRRAFVAATDSVERYRDALNALNVFPVPDGDTGTNMLLTIRAALERCPEAPGATAGEVLGGLADGAFWGARGNSGVILSQLFRGFADASAGRDVCDGPDLVRALAQASRAAYASVANPVEGTMLSVMRAAAEGAGEEASSGGNDEPAALWEKAFHSSVEALYATPSQLPTLMEAGVVDAGGMGVVVILGAALCALTGRDTGVVDEAVAPCCVTPVASGGAGFGGDAGELTSTLDAALESSLETTWGYCIQYLIQGSGLVADEVREGITTDLAGSAVVVGGGNLLRVHVHSTDPGPPLSYGASLGELDRISIENMSRQNTQYVAGHRARGSARSRIAVVAVAPGDGLAALFQDSGCAATVPGGQTMNPSVGQIQAAVAAAAADDVIILPNNSNVVLAAQQAADANSRLHVVPSTTVPQGVAALLAYNPEEALEDNLQAMTAALGDVTTLSVTQAVRDSSVGGVSVKTGDYIGLIEGQIVTSGNAAEPVLKAALDQVVDSPDQVVTLYRGEQAGPQRAEDLRQLVEQAVPGVQVDLVYGGQPHYDYLASVE